jgi:hypothetical protein
MKRYAYAWITAAFFLVSMGLHWWLGWLAFVDDAAQHGQVPDVAQWAIQTGRDTFENWQSEFLQLLWQVVGLAYFLYVGSPSSKESDDRVEAKIDVLLRMQGGQNAERLIAEIDDKYLRHAGHAKPHAHEHGPVKI